MVMNVNKLIEFLDTIDYIRNINYYTNDCMAHDSIINAIKEFAESSEFDISGLFW